MRYIKGTVNVVVDALSRLPFAETAENKKKLMFSRHLSRLTSTSVASTKTRKPTLIWPPSVHYYAAGIISRTANPKASP